MISIIAALSTNRAIGLNNKLLWHLPDDLKFFKEMTLNKPIIMGHRTYQSIGRALPKRTNIILSRTPGLQIPGCIVYSNLEAALAYEEAGDVMVIGGGQIYAECLPRADTLYLTRVHQVCEGDTFFPSFDEQDWRVELIHAHPQFDIEKWQRLRPTS